MRLYTLADAPVPAAVPAIDAPPDRAVPVVAGGQRTLLHQVTGERRDNMEEMVLWIGLGGGALLLWLLSRSDS